MEEVEEEEERGLMMMMMMRRRRKKKRWGRRRRKIRRRRKKRKRMGWRRMTELTYSYTYFISSDDLVPPPTSHVCDFLYSFCRKHQDNPKTRLITKF